MNSSSAYQDPKIGKIYGHCRLERKLGEGGMGQVYLATHTTLNKHVAVKLLRSDLCNDIRAAERFLREARSAAKVEHPAVIQVYDIGQADGTFYIVMQYVEGTTLEDRVRKLGILPVQESLRIITSICEGVRKAHQQGIIHRDIKPDNILLGKDGSVKLTDFGLARAIEGDPNLSQTGRVFGTPHFMAPEQALGERVDQRSDIFSLGATLYRIVTGRYPFQATTLMAVVFKLTHETPPAAREVNPAVPQEVSDLIRDMMVKSARERIGSLDEVIARLRGMQSKSAPPSPDRPSRPIRPVPRAPATASHRQRRSPARIRRLAMALATLSAAGILIYLAARNFEELRALWTPVEKAIATGPDEKVQGPPKGFEAAKAASAAASLAAWENAGGEAEEPAGPEPEKKDRGPAHPALEKKGPTIGSRQALESRLEKFLADIQADPRRASSYLDPEASGPKAAVFLERLLGAVLKARPPGAPPPKVEGIEWEDGGQAAEVAVRGLGRPTHLRWELRRGQWYLVQSKKRSDESR